MTMMTRQKTQGTRKQAIFFLLSSGFCLSLGCSRADTSNAPVTTTSPAGTSTAPSSASAKHRDEALVRIVNATPSATNLDLFAGDLLLFDGLSYKSVTPYRAIDGQRYAFALRPAGMPKAKPLSSNTEGLQDGDFYSAFAMPGDGHGPNLRVVNDKLAAPANGKARLRIVHAGVDAGPVRVRAGGSSDTLFDGVDYQAVTDYRDVSPINGAVEVVGDDRSAPVLVSFNTHLEAGRFYTIVIVGHKGSTPGLEAFLIEDALSP
jgi:hypothetical protein